MPLPQPRRDPVIPPEPNPEVHVPHINTELVEIVAEGFQVIYDCLKEMADYLERRQYEHADFFTVNDKLEKVKDFVEK
jgi:hypothetical protein